VADDDVVSPIPRVPSAERIIEIQSKNGVISNSWKNDASLSAPNTNLHVKIAADTKEIAARTFEDCDRLVTVSFAPESKLQIINAGAFLNCDYLTNVVLPNSVEIIGPGAFSGCTALQSIYLPKSIIGYKARLGSLEGAGLRTIMVEPGSDLFADPARGFLFIMMCSAPQGRIVTLNGVPYWYDNNSGQWFIGEMERIWSRDGVVSAMWRESLPEASSKTNLCIEIDRDTEEISAGAFSACENLLAVSVQTDGKLKTIGVDAFLNCSHLSSIAIPLSVKTIGSGAFAGCAALQIMYIPESVTTLGDWAFAGSGINDIRIESGRALNVDTDDGKRAFLARTMGDVPPGRMVMLNGEIFVYGPLGFEKRTAGEIIVPASEQDTRRRAAETLGGLIFALAIANMAP
jgi:hypothetical protein